MLYSAFHLFSAVGKILADFGVRAAKPTTIVSGADALRAGVDEFEKTLKASEGGVLFVDEVYQLQPKTDKTGK